MKTTDDIIFCDVASHTGVAEGAPGSTPRLYTQPFVREFDDLPDIFGRATLWIAERLAVSVPKAVYVEAPLNPGTAWGHTNARTTMILIGLAANITGVVKARGIPCHWANVRTIRAWYLGLGNIPGEKAKRECMRVSRCLGWDPKNYDEADAAAGFAWACSLHDKSIEPPRAYWTPRMED